jgi:hypothetical protein
LGNGDALHEYAGLRRATLTEFAVDLNERLCMPRDPSRGVVISREHLVEKVRKKVGPPVSVAGLAGTRLSACQTLPAPEHLDRVGECDALTPRAPKWLVGGRFIGRGSLWCCRSRPCSCRFLPYQRCAEVIDENSSKHRLALVNHFCESVRVAIVLLQNVVKLHVDAH